MCKAVDGAREKVKKGITKIEVYQKRPITIVRLNAIVGRRSYSAIEWSKVMWDDRWMPGRGKKIAIGKATKRIARAVVNNESLYEQFRAVQLAGNLP